MRLLWNPDPAPALAHNLGRPLTAPGIGRVAADAPPPDGLVLLEDHGALAPGTWERVADALLRWDVHRGAGLFVTSDAPGAAVGATIVNARRLGPLAVPAACRVTALVDEPTRRGFVYATLPDNPVQGEEQFTAEVLPDGSGVFRVRSHSRPAGLAALAPPVARAAQRQVNRRFVAAARRLAAA